MIKGVVDPVRKVEIIEVIRVDTVCGSGSDEDKDDPIRQLIQYWSKDGELLAQWDTLLPIKDG